MPKYDYSCGTHEWEEQRARLERTAPATCPTCGDAGVFVFHPSTDLMVPQSFRTRWSDVAPSDADGHPMTYMETVRSGKFDRYRREDREEAERDEAAHAARMEPIIRKRAKDEAFNKIRAAERRGVKVYSDEQRKAGEQLAREGA